VVAEGIVTRDCKPIEFVLPKELSAGRSIHGFQLNIDTWNIYEVQHEYMDMHELGIAVESISAEPAVHESSALIGDSDNINFHEKDGRKLTDFYPFEEGFAWTADMARFTLVFESGSDERITITQLGYIPEQVFADTGGLKYEIIYKPTGGIAAEGIVTQDFAPIEFVLPKAWSAGRTHHEFELMIDTWNLSSIYDANSSSMLNMLKMILGYAYQDERDLGIAVSRIVAVPITNQEQK
jgi:hypothetical protein